MTCGPDVHRTAQVLVCEHGEHVPIDAAMRADRMLERGDMDGRTVWVRVVKAAEMLLSREPDGPVH